MRKIKNRAEAGRLLAAKLTIYAHEPELIVLALPRGGVPVAFEVAKTLKAPLDVFLVRKLGVPWNEELAMGAVSNSGTRVLNHDVIAALGISSEVIERVAEREMVEISRREAMYRKGMGPLDVAGKTIILVDDGLATGSTMLVALRALRLQKPAQIIAAVPVSPPSICEQLRDEADDMICLMTPEPFYGVGAWYEDFSQTADAEVVNLLRQAKIRYELDAPRHKIQGSPLFQLD